MSPTVQTITVSGLAYAFIPAAIVVAVLFRWHAAGWPAIHALARMLIQLLLVGFALIYILEARSVWVILLVLSIMLIAASWIAMRPVRKKQPRLYVNAGVAIAVGGGLTLLIVTQFVLDLQPWYLPRYVVPLAGMIFASSMNTISLAAERLEAERGRAVGPREARSESLQASMIPVVNSLFAVGLVTLPGMMTGQILSGVSPLVAAKYQIVVMCMIFGASGISAAVYLAMTDVEAQDT